MPTVADQETKGRLVAAASALFAAHGFHGTKVRDIATRGGVNLASGHYHYGSKKALYLEVFRAQFVEVGRVLQQLGARPTEAQLRRMTPDALMAMLHTRIKGMLDHLLGPPPSVHGQLMMRELMDPSEALPVIVAEFIRPMEAETEQLVARLVPDLSAAQVERCAFSIVGQVLFYRFTMPAVLHMMGRDAYPPDFTAELAAHIVTFSLGGMERVAAARPRRKRRAR
jgi:TetR/AcrR family transcriptional regulator, regulator of cefoperazone and chloramphenicol sensitivity